MTRSLLVRVRETYGEPGAVTYQPDGLADVALTAYFRAAHLEIDVDLGVAINSTEPMIGLFAEDLPADPGSKDHVEIGVPHFTPARRYRVTKAEPDGHGWWTIFLVRAEDLP